MTAGLAQHRPVGVSPILDLPQRFRRHCRRLVRHIIPFGVLYASIYDLEAALF
jgi:hypothetical protein